MLWREPIIRNERGGADARRDLPDEIGKGSRGPEIEPAAVQM